MRAFTTSPTNHMGLIDIREADDNASQMVYFCIPIEKDTALNIKNVRDFSKVFKDGIAVRAEINNQKKIISLTYGEKYYLGDNGSDYVPYFSGVIENEVVEFELSNLNYRQVPAEKLNFTLDIQFYYSGNLHRQDLRSKKLVILEPNWKKLDKLFLSKNILILDWVD